MKHTLWLFKTETKQLSGVLYWKNGNKNFVFNYSRFKKYLIASPEFLLIFLVFRIYIETNFTSLLQILVHLIFFYIEIFMN